MVKKLNVQTDHKDHDEDQSIVDTEKVVVIEEEEDKEDEEQTDLHRDLQTNQVAPYRIIEGDSESSIQRRKILRLWD